MTCTSDFKYKPGKLEELYFFTYRWQFVNSSRNSMLILIFSGTLCSHSFLCPSINPIKTLSILRCFHYICCTFSETLNFENIFFLQRAVKHYGDQPVDCPVSDNTSGGTNFQIASVQDWQSKCFSRLFNCYVMIKGEKEKKTYLERIVSLSVNY